MVRGLWLLWLLPLTAMAADARVWVELETPTVELGQPLRGAVYTSGIEQGVARADLRPLERDFALGETAELASSRGQPEAGGTQHGLSFTLYPRQSGVFTLAPLTLAGVQSEPVAITVSEAHSQGVALSVTARISSTHPWVREQVLVTLEVITPERFASLEIEPQPLPGFEVIPLPGERDRVETAEGERTRLRAGLALFALTAGSHRLALPPVRYRLEGGTRRLFPLPEPVLEVKALPPYVPPTLPVGRVSIGSRLEPEGVLGTRALGFWHIGLQADAVPPHWLPPVQRMLVTDEAIRFLPAQSDYSAAADSTGLHARAEYRVPFIPLADGRLALPALTVQYFDPSSGRLERVVHRPARPLALGLAARLAAGAVMLALLLWGAPRLWRRGIALWQRQRDRRAALLELSEAADAAALRAALRRYAAAQGGPANLSLSAWQQRYGSKDQTEEIRSLIAASYSGRQDIELHTLRKRLLQGVRARHTRSMVSYVQGKIRGLAG